MSKVKINMVGGGFQHEICSSAGSVPKFIEWDKTGNSNISIYIDFAMTHPADKSKRCFAWIVESPSIIPQLIDWIQKNIPFLEDNFEYIFTCDTRFIPLSNKFKLVSPNAVPWIKNGSIHNKTKLVSMIVSNKIYSNCYGHAYRLKMLEKYRNKMDCFGRGWNYIANKEDGLNDYCFSFAMLNDNHPNYFTEPITDCFITGTIPIFWGTPTIGEFFNDKGIIFLDDNFKLEDLSFELYHSKMEYILENYELAKKFPIAEDYIYENFIK
jgi:hypothetical protein